MAGDEDLLFNLAGEILDGADVDWPSVQSSLSQSARSVYQELRALAALNAVQRRAQRPVLPLAPDLPATWGHLLLKSVIAAGAFGTVYRAWDTILERDVALKLLPDSEQTLQEARLLAKVRHPNVVTIFGADRLNGCTGLWMELVGGATLEDLLSLDGPQPPLRVADIGRQLCAALAALHGAGLVHRDVKAHNVMLEPDGRVVLMDFGSASVASARDLAGTPLYLAPEIFRGEAASARSDVYSAGVLLYRLLTGEFPLHGRTFDELRTAHEAGRLPRDVRRVRRDVPRRLADSISRALHAEPEGRFDTAAGMARALAPRSTGYRLVAAAAILVAAGGVAVIALLNTGRLDLSFREPVDRPFTGLVAADAPTARRLQLPDDAAVFAHGLAFSGTHLSFAAIDGGLRVLDTATNVATTLRMPSDGGVAEFSVMSPGADYVAYQWWRPDGRSELRIVGRDGSADHALLRDDAADYVMPLEWSRDGRRVIALAVTPAGEATISAVAVDTGGQQRLERLTSVPDSVSLSPDGRYLAYDHPAGPDDAAVIHVADLQTGQELTLPNNGSHDRAPLWTADGRLFYLSDRSGAIDGWLLQVQDGGFPDPPVLALRNQTRVTPLGFTESGGYYYYVQSGTFDLVTMALDGSGTPRSIPRAYGGRFSGSNIAATYSPDGRTLAFIAARDGLRARNEHDLVLHDVATGTERILPTSIGLGFAPARWSPGGARLLVRGRHRPSNGRGVFVLNAQTGAVEHTVARFLDREQTDLGPINWGEDDSTVWYQQNGRGVIAHDIRTGDERVLLPAEPAVRYTGFGADPPGRRIGASLAARDAIQLIVRDGQTTRVVAAVKPPEGLRFLGWSEDGHDVFYLRGRQNGASLQLRRVSSYGDGRDVLVADLPGATFANLASVTTAGTEVTYTAGTPRSELWLMEHFSQ